MKYYQNSEGYTDLTAYKAIKRAGRNERHRSPRGPLMYVIGETESFREYVRQRNESGSKRASFASARG